MKKEITPISALSLLDARDKKEIAIAMRKRAKVHGIDLREKGVARRLINEGLGCYNEQLNLAREKAVEDRTNSGEPKKHSGNRLIKDVNPEDYAQEINRVRLEARRNRKKKEIRKVTEKGLILTFVVNGIGDAIVQEEHRRKKQVPGQPDQSIPVDVQPETKKTKKRKLISIFEKAVKKTKI